MPGKPVWEAGCCEHLLRGAGSEAPITANPIEGSQRDDAVLEVAGDGKQGVLGSANQVFVWRRLQQGFASDQKFLVLLLCKWIRLDSPPDRRQIVVSEQQTRVLRLQCVSAPSALQMRADPRHTNIKRSAEPAIRSLEIM